MAIFTSENAVNFNTTDLLLPLSKAGTTWLSTSTTFSATNGDRVSGTGTGFLPNGPAIKPAIGTLSSLQADDAATSAKAFTITGLSHSFAGLAGVVGASGSKAGLAYLLNGSDLVFGSGKADLLRGFEGGDVVDAKGGNDKLYGDAGTDLLRGGAGKDFLDGGTGLDTADYIEKTKAVVAVLKGAVASVVKVGGKAEDTIKNIEHLNGGSAADRFTGDGQENTLRGNGGKDTLSGKGGADELHGGLGNDKLTGGTGGDEFYFETTLNGTTNVDRITDFKPGVDKIVLDDDIFDISDISFSFGLFFTVGTAATSSAHRIIYNKAAGKLFYDADGDGTTFGKVLFATVTKNLVITADDFLLVN